MISHFLTQYGPPILLTLVVLGVVLLLVAFLASRGNRVARGPWRVIKRERLAVGCLCAITLFVVAFATSLLSTQAEKTLRENARLQAEHDQDTVSNLISSSYLPLAPLTHTIMPLPPPQHAEKNAEQPTRNLTYLAPQSLVATNVIIVQPGATYRLSFEAAARFPDAPATINTQVRELWFGPAFNLVAYKDDTPWQPDIPDASAGSQPAGQADEAFYTGVFQAPESATQLQLEIRDIGQTNLALRQIGLFPEGVYVEPHPNGTQGAIAFSFDWESAMGGPIHSQGMTVHDVAGATEHGLLMRQGADWLNALFQQYNIKATFYATGYDLLDGNTDHRTFSGNPTYKWASPKNNWGSSYWLTHPWYSDDPFGTYQTDPAWYFGDQTRALLAAGHEIAPHTFGHLYVRGTTPADLATDMDEWLNAAKAQGVPPVTTFAFPWRSSNSVTADFYDVLYQRGISAVTRIYSPDLRDLYTLGAAPVYSYMAVMPDFLLGSASSIAGEEASGAPIGLDQGLAVITETLARRGTTSFWNHPEQMGDAPNLKPVRDTWTAVVQAAAKERDSGRLWIATVAQITAYQRDVMSVTVTLEKTSSSDWQIAVTNSSGHAIQGVTLTLPGDAVSLSSTDATIYTVTRTDSATRLSSAASPQYPTRQLVIDTLKPGATTIGVQWGSGQEPLQ